MTGKFYCLQYIKKILISFFCMVVPKSFSLLLRSLFVHYVNLCAHWRPSIYSLNVTICCKTNRIQSDWLPTVHIYLVRIEMVAFSFGSLLVQSVVNRFLCLCHSSMWSGSVESHRPDALCFKGQCSS